MTAVTSHGAARGRWLGLAALLWAIDQAIKFGVVQTMQLHDSVAVFPGFNGVYGLNPGAAAGGRAGPWPRAFALTPVARQSLARRA